MTLYNTLLEAADDHLKHINKNNKNWWQERTTLSQPLFTTDSKEQVPFQRVLTANCS